MVTEFIEQILEKVFNKNKNGSRNTATERMKMMLVNDRNQLPGAPLAELKAEILEVVAKYFPIDSEGADCQMQSAAGRQSFISATVPIIKNTRGSNGNRSKTRSNRKNKGNLQSINS